MTSTANPQSTHTETASRDAGPAAPALARVTPFPRSADADRIAASEAQSLQGRKAMWPKRAAVLVLLALVAAVVAWVALRDGAAPTAITAPAAAAPVELAAVDVATVGPQALSRSLSLSGSLAPIVQATLKSQVGGEVELVTLREGQDVREGDVIARIETRNLQAQYDRELAAVEKARADLQLATLNRDKNRTLLAQHYISQNTYEATESAYAGSVASLRLAEAQARLAKIGLDDAVIRAPFAGTITRRLVQPGEKVSPDSAVASLVDLRQMVLEAAVPAAEIPSVRIGQQARFKVGGFGEREFVGEVQRINPMTADGSRAIPIYIAVPNADRSLKGGMFAKGELLLDASEPVLAVPQRAVRQEVGTTYVYTLRDGKITRTPVRVGPEVKGSAFVAVHDGLSAGERVIVAAIGADKEGHSAVVSQAQRSAPAAGEELAEQR